MRQCFMAAVLPEVTARENHYITVVHLKIINLYLEKTNHWKWKGKILNNLLFRKSGGEKIARFFLLFSLPYGSNI